MILAFEYLNRRDLEELGYLNPMMDFRFDFENRIYYWNTGCGGYDEYNKEIRVIKMFSLSQVKQGFICDDWEESRLLSGYLQNRDNFKEGIEEVYKWIPDYLELRKENHFLDTIAIPISIYLDYYRKYDELPFKIE